MTGMFNIGGPPVVLYYLQSTQDRLSYKCSLEFTYFVTSISVVLSHILLGNFDQTVAQNAGLALIAVLSGSLVGFRVLQTLNQGFLKQLVYVILILSAFLLILRQ
jgi:uncharacterized membrane protein YfcA